MIREAVEALRRGLDAPGLIVEDKGVTASVHYRLSPDTTAARDAVLAFLAAAPEASGLRITEGKLVVELRPPVDIRQGNVTGAAGVGEGTAGRRLHRGRRYGRGRLQALHALASQGVCRGLALGVVGAETPPEIAQESDMVLRGVPEVEELLQRVALG